MSRHYYDMVMLSRSAFVERALQRLDVLDVVAKHKALFFRSGWANYGDAKPGSLRLVPTKGRQPDLSSDYTKMRPMFFGDPPPFADLIHELSELEQRINDKADASSGP